MRLIKHLGLFILLLAATATFAQPKQKKLNKIKVLKIGFFVEHLDLTSAESEQFWPIYNKFNADKHRFGKKPSKSKVEAMNDAELNQYLQAQLDRQEQILALKRKLIQDLRPVLPLRKIVKLEFVEKKFRRELLHRLGQKKGIKAQKKAETNRLKAQKNREKANRNRKKAEKNREKAVINRKKAQKNREIIEGLHDNTE